MSRDGLFWSKLISKQYIIHLFLLNRNVFPLISLSCISSLFPCIFTLQLTAVRTIPWAKANLNYTAQALIISAGKVHFYTLLLSLPKSMSFFISSGMYIYFLNRLSYSLIQTMLKILFNFLLEYLALVRYL